MSDQDADHLRNAITRDQTACRCGHLLAACADCRDWLSENSPRIARDWRDFINWDCFRHGYAERGISWAVDAAEADDLACFKSLR